MTKTAIKCTAGEFANVLLALEKVVVFEGITVKTIKNEGGDSLLDIEMEFHSKK